MKQPAHENSEFDVQSCGVLIMRPSELSAGGREFLLMQHPRRWDLPKGHVDPGETELECALRELEEETAIRAADIQLDPAFRYEEFYDVRMKRHKKKLLRKSLVIFLAELTADVEIVLTEHDGFEWFPWSPPHKIQPRTIDPLLDSVATHFTR